jgi:hypothetical protein
MAAFRRYLVIHHQPVSRRGSVPSLGMLCVLAWCLAGAGCNRAPSQKAEAHPPVRQREATSPTQAVDRELSDSLSSFVGLSMGPKGELRIALADSGQFARGRRLAEAKWREVAKTAESQVLILQLVTATLPPVDLLDAKTKMRDVLTLADVVFLDLDESCGCITVGVRNAAADAAVKAFAVQRGVPSRAVRTVVTAPVVRLQTLTGSFRPTKGGVQIRIKTGDCSLGLPVFHNTMTRKGILTASHCTEGSQGGSEGTLLAQPGGAWFETDRVAVERIDPYLFDSGLDASCPTGRQCRRSDAAFAEYNQGTLGFVGRIARPSTTCTVVGTPCGVALTNVNDDIRITSVTSAPVMGALIDKVGRTTGWTRGAVTGTCTDANVQNDDGSDSMITMLCQIIVAGTSGDGDSGGPTFVFDATNGTASFTGILWGGGGSGPTSIFVFSPIGALTGELGSMEFHE